MEIDGLDKIFDQDGTSSEWEGPLGQSDVDDFQQLAPASKRTQLGNVIADMQNYDASGFGFCLPRDMALAEDIFNDDSSEFDVDEVEEIMETTPSNDSDNNVCIVCELDYEFFCSKLVEHFDILYQQ